MITDKATSGVFSDEAKEQKTQADAWRVNAILLGILTAVVAVIAVVFSALDEHGSTTTHLGAFVVAVC